MWKVRRIWVVCILAVLLGCGTWFLVQLQNHGLKIAILDVGQGDAIFIETPERYQILIDGGPDQSVLRELGRVMPFWDRSLDLVVSTHPDADHLAGLIDVLRNYQVSELIGPGHPGTTSLAHQFWAQEQKEPNLIFDGTIFNPKQITLPSGVVVRVLHPQTLGLHPIETNDNSLYTRVDYRGRSFLTAGDSSGVIESKMAIQVPQFLNTDILKIAHHGSRYSSGELFLRTVSPQLALISVGCHNRYGHPARETINRLSFLSIPYRDTCNSGRITLNIDKNGSVSVDTEK